MDEKTVGSGITFVMTLKVMYDSMAVTCFSGLSTITDRSFTSFSMSSSSVNFATAAFTDTRSAVGLTGAVACGNCETSDTW